MDILNWLSKYKIIISLDNIIVFLPLIILAIIIIRKAIKKIKKSRKIAVTQICLKGITVDIGCNKTTKKIAHQAWTELITRKLALPFDEENDVIVEIYNSWYSIYNQFREIIKELADSNDTEANKLIELLVEILNTDLRDHLTKYQARFRKWYDKELEKYPDEEPQTIQKKYKNYKELIYDIKKVNNKIVELTNKLNEIRSK
ncbi:MAG: hypothetical protein RR478_04815 [Bacilli bacterium]